MKTIHTIGSKVIVAFAIAAIVCLLAGSAFPSFAKVNSGQIYGTVTNTDGVPLEDIQVSLWWEDPYTPGEFWWFLGMVTTNSIGVYSTGEDLPTGPYRIGFEDITGMYASEYYHDSPTFAGATTVILEEGGELLVNEDLEYASGVAGCLSGLVTSAETADPVAGVLVFAFTFTDPGWELKGTGLTIGDGSYSICGLFEGVYRVYFWPAPGHNLVAEYFDDVHQSIELGDDISVFPGATTPNINAALDIPQPPLAGAETPTGSVFSDPATGFIFVNVPTSDPSDVTIMAALSCPGGVSPQDVVLRLFDEGGYVDYPMEEVPPGSGAFQVTIPFGDLPDITSMTLLFTCSGSPVESPIGQILLYDPNGIIVDILSGQPVAGASVTLYTVPGWRPQSGPDDTGENTCQSNLSKPAGEPWSQPAPVELGQIALPASGAFDPAINGITTGANGLYGWRLDEGCWYVEVSAPGYQPLTSPLVGTPPEVTDLDLDLTPSEVIFLPFIIRD